MFAPDIQYNRYIEVQTTTKRRSRRIRRRIATVITALTVVLVTMLFLSHMVDNYELYSTIAKNNLRVDLNNGEPDAIARYKYYINKDIYLFNGPLTIELMAERHGFDFDTLYVEYLNSGLCSAQQFFEKWVIPRIRSN